MSKLLSIFPCSPQHCPSLRGRGAARPPYRGGHTPNPLPLNGSAALPYGGGRGPPPIQGWARINLGSPVVRQLRNLTQSGRSPRGGTRLSPRHGGVRRSFWSETFGIEHWPSAWVRFPPGTSDSGDVRGRPTRAVVGQWSRINPCFFL